MLNVQNVNLCLILVPCCLGNQIICPRLYTRFDKSTLSIFIYFLLYLFYLLHKKSCTNVSRASIRDISLRIRLIQSDFLVGFLFTWNATCKDEKKKNQEFKQKNKNLWKVNDYMSEMTGDALLKHQAKKRQNTSSKNTRKKKNPRSKMDKKMDTKKKKKKEKFGGFLVMQIDSASKKKNTFILCTVIIT